VLSAGSVISASLITGLRSDLPGLVTAQVISQVFDSPTGRILLIPQGSRLIGSYDSVVAFGQKRALIVWQRIMLPDGSSMKIDNVPATDASGYAGLQDKVDFHTWALLKGVALSTLLGVGCYARAHPMSDQLSVWLNGKPSRLAEASRAALYRDPRGGAVTVTRGKGGSRFGAPQVPVAHKGRGRCHQGPWRA
jgi:type IV secretory pathway VirB10-like protein